jgi:hypothetical protein
MACCASRFGSVFSSVLPSPALTHEIMLATRKLLRQLPALIGFLEASVRNADAAHQKHAPACIGGDDQPTA